MTENNGGAPENNGNAEKHGLYSDRSKLFQRLSDNEKKLVIDISTDLMNRIDGTVGAYEREAIRNAAVDAVKRSRANEYILEEDLVQSGDEAADRANKAYSRLMRDTTQELEKLGLLEQNPETRKADAMESGWMERISNAKDASDNE
ncbi:hypothetical protein [Natrialba asiatica]|uniref:Uncharacterized protein n=1 Tax=Natrialba asiatica (strain ATCC 700177 / DSM 12278 / JCM 9576 / FERM P-10747 / NBRC 102637 / 172P1) TaxID=29540 RepID=M0ATS7_NATA1|nr:hypothetical protein [Natrialba asiatica]ELZ00779.1 hypothetical protein C481_11110 [Natrialba asiatica DSM 12278]